MYVLCGVCCTVTTKGTNEDNQDKEVRLKKKDRSKKSRPGHGWFCRVLQVEDKRQNAG
jgi:hypothetical protein